MTILVAGATGTIGRRLVPLLVERGHQVRALVRSEGKAVGVARCGAEAVVGDWDDPASVEQAMDGIDTLFLLTPSHPRAAEWASVALVGAKRAGVSRVVRLSTPPPGAGGSTDNTYQHGHTEREIHDSGLGFTILRPNFFMQNLLLSAPTLLADSSIYWGLGEGRVGLVDVGDIAEVAARVLTDARWDGATYTLTGPQSLTFHDVAGALSRALGRQVKYVPVSLAAVEEACLAMGLGGWYASMTRDYSKAYAEGWGDLTTNAVEQITGRPARSFATFAREEIAPALDGEMVS